MYKDGKLVPFKGQARRQVHAVITDEIEPIESMATAKREIFTSRSQYRRHLKQHGYRETGGEHLKDAPKPKTEAEELAEQKKDIEQSYYDVKYDRVEFTEREKQTHLEEQRKWGPKIKIKPPV